ncbi:ASCH domain-containing protein [Achromobacter ruhlandii]|uniref:ASCH domain-containing protein n=1 Tax=Achromobacter ruhlandii TaxID=72557 RepID=UPI0006C2CBBA|nr:Uncharacterised protein [Achromobacter ruhlandii]
MADLHLALKGEYFDAIKAGTKVEEFRLLNDYWRRRLVDRDYDLLVLTRGYPRADDVERRLVLPYRGYAVQRITRPHFGPNPVDVFALNVEPLPGAQWTPSNGTVGYSFVSEVCGTCSRDQDERCPILARSFRGEAVEWRSTNDGQICVAYTPAGEPAPMPPCAHTMALPLSADTDKKEM